MLLQKVTSPKTLESDPKCKIHNPMMLNLEAHGLPIRCEKDRLARITSQLLFPSPVCPGSTQKAPPPPERHCPQGLQEGQTPRRTTGGGDSEGRTRTRHRGRGTDGGQSGGRATLGHLPRW